MKIITSGSIYIDIDAYASCIAYRELFKLKGIEAKAVTTAKPNESVTKSLLQLNEKLDKYEKSDKEEYIIIDVSNKDFFDKIVQEDKIIEIIDHHVGFEKDWKRRLGRKADIEFIGAVATIIVERYEKENLLDKITGNPIEYSEKYFLECEKEIEENLIGAIENDTKIEKVNEILPYVFGQLVVWDKENILKNKKIIYETLEKFDKEWMMNLICLKEGKSYIISNHKKVKGRMEELMKNKFEKDIMILPDVWLRKEIIKKSFLALNNAN